MNCNFPKGMSILALLKLPHNFYQVKLSQAISSSTVAGQINSEKVTHKHIYSGRETNTA